MSIQLRFDTSGVDWNEAVLVVERAPLGTREPEKLKRAFTNSHTVCFAWDNDTLVGMGRALSDGEYQSVIYDLCILPEHQGQGLGSRMMNELLNHLSTPTIILWSKPGKEAFYSKLGFSPMLTSMARYEDPERAASLGYIKLN